MEFYTQEKYYTCGCACFRMILSDQGLPDLKEEEIEKRIGSTPLSGTNYKKLIKAAEDLHIDVYTKENATFEDLENYRLFGYTILVAYSCDISHYSLYVGCDEKNIYLCDPTFGPRYKVKKSDFLYDWVIDHTRYQPMVDQFGLILDPSLDRNRWFAAFKF